MASLTLVMELFSREPDELFAEFTCQWDCFASSRSISSTIYNSITFEAGTVFSSHYSTVLTDKRIDSNIIILISPEMSVCKLDKAAPSGSPSCTSLQII